MKDDTCGVLGIDSGGESTIVVSKDGIEKYPSVKGIYGKRTLTQVTGKHDFIVEHSNKIIVAGDLAVADCEYPIRMHSFSKANEFFDLSVLIAVHQYGYRLTSLTIDVPIESHTEEEKNNLVERLKGSHTLTVNGEKRTFCIDEVKVCPEGVVGYFIHKPVGKVRWLDLGSRTINYGTSVSHNNKVRFIDTESGTLWKGLATFSNGINEEALGDFICGQLLAKWNPNDIVNIHGGGALNERLVNKIKTYFINAKVMENPQEVNGVALYELGKIAYGMD